MANFLIAQRYAEALSRALPDADADRLESNLGALEELADLFRHNEQLHDCLANPGIDVAEREAVLDSVLDKVGTLPMLKRLSHELLERGRIGLLPEIAEVFSDIVDQRLNRATAYVTTAADISDAERDRIQAALERFSGKTIWVRHTVDPDLLGGVRARIGEVVVDGSLRTRLNRIREALLSDET